MANKSNFIDTKNSVAVGDSFVPSRGDEKDMFIIHTIICGDDATVYWERDTTGDGTYEISIQLDTITQGISTNNYIPVNEYQGVRVRVENSGTSTADFAASGKSL